MKYQPTANDLSLGIALYDLREENKKTNDPSNPLNTLQAGATKNTGAGLEARVGFDAFEIIAHYNCADVDGQFEAAPENPTAIWWLAPPAAFLAISNLFAPLKDVTLGAPTAPRMKR